MAGRVRGRSRRPDDRNNIGRKNALPSRYLWVGNLSNKVTEDILINLFLQFGELERVSLQAGRNFAFIDFKYEEAAFAAMRSLQGFNLAGSPIVVEFTKDNKSFGQSVDEEMQKSRTMEELPPSEALWVGYPPHIEVDEAILRMSFSPFGAIRKITTFTDRSYAFVCFESVSAASRAKAALEGRLFGSPRVQIRFAKSDSGFSDSGRYLRNLPLSPPFRDGNIGNLPHFNEEYRDNSIPFRGVKKLRTDLFPPEDELPEFTPSAPVKLKEWAWEGIIAKGGNCVCRARCFPVGKPMDMMLPAVVDCTARTSIEMLSKHFYQAPSSWVVFFVPQTDADIESYNDFMHYLEEKQRVAVAKINEDTTLFLVAPSEFSENVLKVPGKLSISGVVLRFEPQTSYSTSSLQSANITRDTSLASHVSFPYEKRHEQYMPARQNPRAIKESNFPNYSAGNMGIPERPPVSSAGPVSALQPEQIASVASSVLGKRTAERPQESSTTPVAALNQEQLAQLASRLTSQSNRVTGGPSSSITASQQQAVSGPQGSTSGQTEDSDPGRRLQATLKLAATLLQNVQQRRGT